MAEALVPVTQEALETILQDMGLSVLDDIIKDIFEYDPETETYYEISEIGDKLDTLNETVETISEQVEGLEGAAARPFLTTPLSEYSVTEGLLATILFVMFIQAIARLIREGFSWL